MIETRKRKEGGETMVWREREREKERERDADSHAQYSNMMNTRVRENERANGSEAKEYSLRSRLHIVLDIR